MNFLLLPFFLGHTSAQSRLPNSSSRPDAIQRFYWETLSNAAWRSHTPGRPAETHPQQGSRAVMEVRAHDVPFMLQHGQRVAKLVFEELAEVPTILYGQDIGSSYQHQERMLSKHFRA